MRLSDALSGHHRGDAGLLRLRRFAGEGAFFGVLLWTFGGGCLAGLPEVAPEDFACADNVADDQGFTPCPFDRVCRDGRCVERLNCRADGAEPGESCIFGQTRCEARQLDDVAMVGCFPGVPTATEAGPAETRCGCGAGQICVGARATDGALYRVEDASAGAAVGAWSERRCTLACSGEADCGIGARCQPVSWTAPGAEALDGRDTVAGCWPQVTGTATVAAQAGAPCLRREDCPSSLRCVYRWAPVADHPVAPIWAGAESAPYALDGVCQTSPALLEPGRGCTAGNQCTSGLCVDGRCARTCDPKQPEGCGASSCVPRWISETLPSGAVVGDWASVCGA